MSAEVVIPWAGGEFRFQRVPVGRTRADGTIGPGRWCLHPRSTVPFVSVQLGQSGERVITWGDTVDVPEGQRGRVANASFHAGDIVLAATGSHASAPGRPATVTIPTAFEAVVLEGVPTLRTGPLDVRMARRAYLWMPTVTAPAAPASVLWTVLHVGPTRGEAFAPALVLPASGQFADLVPLATFGTCLPLGIGSGRNVDSAGNSLAELRPMAFRDAVSVQIPTAVGDPLGVGPTTAAFFEVEY